MRVSLMVVTLFTALIVSQSQERAAITIQAAMDNATPYVGEPVRYIINVFDSTDTVGLEIGYPAFDGFGQATPDDPIIGSQIIGNIRYTTYTQDILLYPNLAGVYVIEPVSLKIPETPFASQQIIQSTQTVVTVRALPVNAPAGYTNAVGNLALSITAAPLQTTVGSAITAQIRLSGTGNLAQLTAPQFPDSAVWRIIDGTRTLEGTPIDGSVHFTYTFLPQAPGEQTLPQLSYPVFDPQSGTYRVLTTDVIPVSVVGNVPENSVAPDGTSQPTPAQMMPSGVTAQSATPRLTPPLIYWLLPLSGAILAWLVRPIKLPARRQITNRQTTQARQQLSAAMGLPPAQAFPTIGNILREVIQNQAARHQQTPQTWVETLEPDLRDRVEQCIRYADSARYAPATAADIRVFVQQVYAVIRTIETVL